MKKRIISLLVTLVLAVSVVIGVSVFANAESTDGLKNTAISLVENVTLKMEVAVAAPTEGAYAKITLPGGRVDATQLVATAPKKGDNYVFTAEVAVKDLADDVTIEICNADGTTLVAAATTTALAYCNSYTEGEYLGIVNALKAYAVAADAYFDKDKTVESAPAADFSAVADKASAGNLPAGLTHRSATLLLESETTIRHYFELAEGKSIDGYTFFVDLDKDGKADAGEALTAKSKSTEDGKTVYFVDVEGLTPNQLDELYTVAATDGTDTYTCDYGVLTYAKRAYAGGDLKAKNLAAALLAYSNEAGKLTGTITFNVDGGSAVEAQTYEYGVTTPVSANTTKNGFTLIGWFDARGNRVTDIPANQTGNLTLTAKWGKTYLYEDFSASTSAPVTGAADIGSVKVNASGAATFEAKDGHLEWTTTGKYSTVSPANNNLRAAESNLVTITLKIARANGANVPHIDFRLRAKNSGGSNVDLVAFNINTNENTVKANKNFVISIPEVKDGYATLKTVIDFETGLISFYDANDTFIYEYTPATPNGFASFSDFKKSLLDNAPNLYISGYNASPASILYIDEYEIREGKVDYSVDDSAGVANVTFDSNGGSAVENMSYVAGVETPITAVPTRSGYSFIGWFDAQGARYNAIPEDATGDIALTAKWGKTYLYEDFSASTSAPVTGSADIGSVKVNASGTSKFEVKDGHLEWTTTGKYATVSSSNNNLRAAESDVVTITLKLARANGANVPHVDFRLRAKNSAGSNADLVPFTINTNENNVKANKTAIINIPEVKDGYATLKIVINFATGLISFYDGNDSFIYEYTPAMPNGFESFSDFRKSLLDNAPNLYVSGYNATPDSILYIDEYEIREGGIY